MHRKKRRENFDYNETKLLLKFWGEPAMQENMKSNYLKTPFIEEIAEKMRMHGFNRSPKEVETRLRTIKCSYTRIRKDLDAGWIRKPTWKYFDDVHEILGPSIKKELIYHQSAEPLDLSTSPTIKLDMNNFISKASTSKNTTKKTSTRTNFKKWIPVPLKIVKRELTQSQVPHCTRQHTVPSNEDETINETSSEQMLPVNENHYGSDEPQRKTSKQSLIEDSFENKDETNQGKTYF